MLLYVNKFTSNLINYPEAVFRTAVYANFFPASYFVL